MPIEGPITTERLQLVSLRAEHAPAIADMIGSLSVARWLTMVPHPYTLADAEDFLSRVEAEAWENYAITQEGTFMGVVTNRDDLGYWLGEPYWGKGFMTEAARAVVARHFARGAETLTSGYHLGNTASAGVLRKLGFVPTRIETAFAKSLGQEVELQRMSLTRAAWEATL